jgi:hypothetical protein
MVLIRQDIETFLGKRGEHPSAPGSDAAVTATPENIGLDYPCKKWAHEPVCDYWGSLTRMII